MCQKCRASEKELADVIERHKNTCEDTTCVMHVALLNDENAVVFGLISKAFSKVRVVQERILDSRKVYDAPSDLPYQTIKDWEQHVIEAAELLGRARATNEAREKAQATETVQ